MGESRFITVRKLAALDLIYRGARRSILEFALAAFVLCAVGVAFLLLARVRTPETTAIGVYLTFLGLNYIPLLVYSVSMAMRKGARREVDFELAHPERYRSKYGAQRLLLMVPLALDLLAISQAI